MINKLLQNKIENFSKLPDQECSFLIQNNLLEMLEMEDQTYLELEILTKFIDIEYELREDLCRLFNSAIKNNTQKIASVSIGDWLKSYLKKYYRVPREIDTFLQYSLNDPRINNLNEKDTIKLMRIFRLYDYLLVVPISSMEDERAVCIMKFPMYLKQTIEEIKKQIIHSPMKIKEPSFSSTASEKLPLRDLLRKYPAVGEQIVTGGQLKLAHFDRPVRPSIKNWIYDYTSQLGQDRHNSMQRMKYLFSSPNAKNLSSPDREKLGIILKSFDENVPLPVDAGRNEIIFSFTENENSKSQAPISKKIPSSKPQIFKSTPAAKQPIPESQQQSFVKPYEKNYSKPKMAPPAISHSSKKSAPIRQEANKIGNWDLEIGNSATNDGLRYTNPYPKPGTHEPQSARQTENISRLRFDEGLPPPASLREPARNATPNATGKPAEELKSQVQPEPPKSPPSDHPQRNIIKPITSPRYGETSSPKPEPRIEGNTVDLSQQ